MTFQFAWPWMLALLPLPWLVRRLLPPVAAPPTGAIRVPFFALLEHAEVGGPRSIPPWRLLLAGACWALLVAAAARPQWVGEPQLIPVSGRNLMLAVDVSGSMKATDLELDGRPADRLAVVKTLGADFLERRIGDRVGLILFGSQAYLQAPLTFDRVTVRTLLEEAVIGIAGERTAIGDAIGLAVKRLQRHDAEHRVLVLMTDGANTAGVVDSREAARLAALAGLKVYTVGIGAEHMRVDGLFGSRVIDPSTELDEETLMFVAAKTGGRYFRATSGQDLEAVYAELDRIEPVVQPRQNARRVDDVFHWPLGAAALTVFGWIAAAVAGRARALAG